MDKMRMEILNGTYKGKLQQEIKRLDDSQNNEKETKTMPTYCTEYRTMKKEIRNKCRQTKDEWLNELFRNTKNITDKVDMHK